MHSLTEGLERFSERARYEELLEGGLPLKSITGYTREMELEKKVRRSNEAPARRQPCLSNLRRVPHPSLYEGWGSSAPNS
jgi:hypothetical protein